MPTYVYKCPQCNRTREVVHGMQVTHAEACADCHKPMCKIPAAAPGVILRGNGWGGSKKAFAPK